MYVFMSIQGFSASFEFTASTRKEAVELACMRFKIPRPSEESMVAERNINEACVKAKDLYEKWVDEDPLTDPVPSVGFEIPRVSQVLFVQHA